MYLGRRIFAFFIDSFIGIFSGMFVVGFGTDLISTIFDKASVITGNGVSFFDLFQFEPFGFGILFFWVLIWPSLLLGFLHYKFKKSLGKLIFKLEVIGSRGSNLSFGHFLGRELLKLLSIGLTPLWILPLIQAAMNRRTFYDQIFGTQVAGKVKLTETQKKFQKYYQ